VLDTCAIQPNTDDAAPQNTNSALWNGMIAPLTKMALFGFLWYQVDKFCFVKKYCTHKKRMAFELGCQNFCPLGNNFSAI
jgi:hypothetical protein